MGKTPEMLFLKRASNYYPNFWRFIFSSKFRVEIESNRPFGRTKYTVKKNTLRRWFVAYLLVLPKQIRSTPHKYVHQIPINWMEFGNMCNRRVYPSGTRAAAALACYHQQESEKKERIKETMFGVIGNPGRPHYMYSSCA
jgi:hypothetical protein